jgi:cell division protein FtsI (penicillin-binding protein 3)
MKNARTLVVREVGGWRRLLVLGVMGLAACIVLGRAFELQVLQREFLAHEGDKRSLRTVAVPAHRGAIRDRRGEALALSAPVESLWVIPSELLAAPDYLPPLAKLLDMKQRELSDFLHEREGKQFVYLRRHMNPDEARRILALKAPGLFSQREYRRYYPAGEVAGHVVGFTDLDDHGQEGIEAAQDAVLAGKPGARQVIRDRNGRVVEEGEENLRTAQPGQDVLLTLDLRLQYIAYRELKAAVARNRAKGGLVIVADAQNGDILAIANQPGFNPNRPDERASAGLRNRAVTDIFEPGSTIKPLLVAQALELGAFRSSDHIQTAPGFFKVGRLTVRDIHPHGDVDLAQLLAVSSNVGAAKIGLTLGPEAIYTGYRNFGIGEPVSAGFRGEATGFIPHFSKWGEIATATASYGYGVSVNALQLVRAYCAFANDGLLPQLSVVDQPRGAPVQRAVSVRVAREVRRMMEGVIAVTGTAQKAAVSGYRVAGKTGTIRKNEGRGYFENRHQSVFIGVMPGVRSRLVGLVMIDEPVAGEYYGGLVAAPVFANVMQVAARLLQLPPDAVPTAPATPAAPKTLLTVSPPAAPAGKTKLSQGAGKAVDPSGKPLLTRSAVPAPKARPAATEPRT